MSTNRKTIDEEATYARGNEIGRLKLVGSGLKVPEAGLAAVGALGEGDLRVFGGMFGIFGSSRWCFEFELEEGDLGARRALLERGMVLGLERGKSCPLDMEVTRTCS